MWPSANQVFRIWSGDSALNCLIIHLSVHKFLVHTFRSTMLSVFNKSKSWNTGKTTCMEVLKLVVSAHMRMSTQNGLVSLQCRWEVLKCLSFALNEWMPSLLFTSEKCFKTAQKQVYINTYGEYLQCVSLLGAVFLGLSWCIYQLPQPVCKSTNIDNELKV